MCSFLSFSLMPEMIDARDTRLSTENYSSSAYHIKYFEIWTYKIYMHTLKCYMYLQWSFFSYPKKTRIREAGREWLLKVRWIRCLFWEVILKLLREKWTCLNKLREFAVIYWGYGTLKDIIAESQLPHIPSSSYFL